MLSVSALQDHRSEKIQWVSFLLEHSQPCLLLPTDSSCHNYLVFKNEWSTANQEQVVQSKEKKKTLFTAFPLISFQDSRHNICHRDFNPSEGCSLLTFRGMEGLKKEERESSKHPPIRNAQHLVWGNGISRQWCQNSDAASADDTYFHGWIPHAFENLLQFWLPAQWFLQFVSYHKGVLFLFWHNTNYIARDGHTTVNSTDNSGFP